MYTKDLSGIDLPSPETMINGLKGTYKEEEHLPNYPKQGSIIDYMEFYKSQTFKDWQKNVEKDIRKKCHFSLIKVCYQKSFIKKRKKKEQEVCITTDRYSSQKDFQEKEVHTGAVSGSCGNGRGMRRGQCRKADQPVPYSCKYGTGYPYKDAGRKYHHRKRSRCEEKGDCLEGEIRCRK